MKRVELLLRGLDKETMTGVEIGAWTSPMAPKSEGWQTSTVDFADTAELRSIAENHSSSYMRALADKIEEVDFVWRGEKLDTLLLERHPEGFDYLIASHVFEHIPDLIELFQQVERVIKPGGVISLALPDKRLCFDIFRQVSLTQDLLLAHRQKRTRHSPETLFASYAYQALDGDKGGWPRSRMPDVHAVKQLKRAYEGYQTEQHLTDPQAPYIDAHAWVLVPASFDLVMLELNMLGLINLKVRGEIVEGEESEFLVQLEHGRIELDNEALEARREDLLLRIIGPEAPGCTARDHPEILRLRDEVAELRAYGGEVDAQLASLQLTAHTRHEAVQYLQDQLKKEWSYKNSIEQQLAIRLSLQENLEKNAEYYRGEIEAYRTERTVLRDQATELRTYIADLDERHKSLYEVAETRHETIGNLQATLRGQRLELDSANKRLAS